MQAFRITVISALAASASAMLAACAGPQPSVAPTVQDYDKTFLADYSNLVAKSVADGTDLTYIPPGVFDRIEKYDSLLVDQPEVLISPKSDYKGAKPADLTAISELLRKDFSDQLTAGGYHVVNAPGPNVLYVRMALTDLSLEKKKRGVLSYTPVGIVVHAGVEAVRSMMGNYDITGMAIQGEVSDSESKEVLAQVVDLRGGEKEGKQVRIDFDALDATIKDFGSRLRCRLDNAHVPAGQRIDCLDAAARHAREATKTKP